RRGLNRKRRAHSEERAVRPTGGESGSADAWNLGRTSRVSRRKGRGAFSGVRRAARDGDPSRPKSGPLSRGTGRPDRGSGSTAQRPHRGPGSKTLHPVHLVGGHPSRGRTGGRRGLDRKMTGDNLIGEGREPSEPPLTPPLAHGGERGEGEGEREGEGEGERRREQDDPVAGEDVVPISSPLAGEEVFPILSPLVGEGVLSDTFSPWVERTFSIPSPLLREGIVSDTLSPRGRGVG